MSTSAAPSQLDAAAASVAVRVGVGSNLALDTARVGCMGLKIEAHFAQVGVGGDSKAGAGGEMKLTGAA